MNMQRQGEFATWLTLSALGARASPSDAGSEAPSDLIDCREPLVQNCSGDEEYSASNAHQNAMQTHVETCNQDDEHQNEDDDEQADDDDEPQINVERLSACLSDDDIDDDGDEEGQAHASSVAVTDANAIDDVFATCEHIVSSTSAAAAAAVAAAVAAASTSGRSEQVFCSDALERLRQSQHKPAAEYLRQLSQHQQRLCRLQQQQCFTSACERQNELIMSLVRHQQQQQQQQQQHLSKHQQPLDLQMSAEQHQQNSSPQDTSKNTTQQVNHNTLAAAAVVAVPTSIATNAAAAAAAAAAVVAAGKQRRLYKCRHCAFETYKKVEHWLHIRIHMRPEKLLACESCQFVTEYKHHLEYHQRNHSGYKPFKCEHCDYQCVNKSMLNSHMKSHSSVYQYQCGDCKYATKYVHSLKMHLRKYNHQPAQLMIDVYGRKRGANRSPNISSAATATQQHNGAADKAAAAATTTPNADSPLDSQQCILDLRVDSKLNKSNQEHNNNSGDAAFTSISHVVGAMQRNR